MPVWPYREAYAGRDGVGRLPDLDAQQWCYKDHEVDRPIAEEREVCGKLGKSESRRERNRGNMGVAPGSIMASGIGLDDGNCPRASTASFPCQGRSKGRLPCPLFV